MVPGIPLPWCTCPQTSTKRQTEHFVKTPVALQGFMARGFFLNCLAVLKITGIFKVMVSMSRIFIQTTQTSCFLACFHMILRKFENVGCRLFLPSLKPSSCLVPTMTCEGQLSLEIFTTVMGCPGRLLLCQDGEIHLPGHGHLGDIIDCFGS